MSRHRNVRAIDVDEEYEGYYSCYGHSEDEYCLSPQTEAQFLYDRSGSHHLSAFLDKTLAEENEDECPSSLESESVDYKLNAVDSAKLQTCVEAMQDVVGDAISDCTIRKAAYDNHFNLEKALSAVLLEKAPNPQRYCPATATEYTKLNLNYLNAESIGEKSVIGVLTREAAQGFKVENYGTVCRDEDSSQESVFSYSTITSKKPSAFNAETVPLRANDEKSNQRSARRADAVSEIYNRERGKEKPLINLVVIGHVDAGKSTLMGHLLFRLGQVSKRAMHKFEQDSKRLGKSSFMYAWVLDETQEERSRGITMDVAQSKFETSQRSVVLLDAPGHKDFIPNMITGAAQADVAILVIDSTRGEFETGFETGGQTQEHTMLIRSLGVSQLAIAVNKMDNVNWSQERFQEIKSKMASFLKTVGFKACDVAFIPCSGLSGENLVSPPESSELKNWYSGPCLVDVVDRFVPPERPVEKPLRMCISDVFKGVTGGFCFSGKIESGFIKTGDKVSVMPALEQGSVKSINLDDNNVQHAFAGDQVIIQVSGIDINNVCSGSMVCDIERPVSVTSIFEARLVVFNVPVPITRGFPVILHYQSMSEQAICRTLISQLNRSTGEVIRKKPRCLTKNCSAIVEIEVNKPICIELFKDFKDLGRFMLRYGGSTIAAGLVSQIKKSSRN